MLTLAAALFVLGTTPTQVEKAAPASSDWGSLSLLIDSGHSDVGAVSLGVHLVPHAEVQAELGLPGFQSPTARRGDAPSWAFRVGPSGYFLNLRNGRSEGLSLRGSLLAGVESGYVKWDGSTPGPELAVRAQIELSLWAFKHGALTATLSGGLRSNHDTEFPVLPAFGVGLGLTI